MGSDGYVLAIDIFILAAATVYSFVCLGFIAAMWSLRRNFFIVLRSPLLACTLGLCITLRFEFLIFAHTLHWDHSGLVASHELTSMIEFPALLISEFALVMSAVRLLVMFFPKLRAKWGRFTREKDLVYGLVCAYILMEGALWSGAAAVGVSSRTGGMLATLELFSGSTTVVAGALVGGRLNKVDDLLHMSTDIRVVGTLLLLMSCVHTGLHYVSMSPMEYKYYHIVLMALSHPPIVWLMNIRPVREVERHIPARRRSRKDFLLPSPYRRWSTKNIRVGVAANEDNNSLPWNGEVYLDDNRLTSIMNFQPLREAFGEFCRRSLCGESFQFLVDVEEFKDLIAGSAAEENEKSFGGFGGYLAIVNDYIKDGSHSEVNIASTTKRSIMKHMKFTAYAALQLEERKDLFGPAEREIKIVLADNLLNKFLVSDPYTKVVDFEGLT
ncbi:unnamed protein product [Ectocarpus sp. 8 AP-2014]